MTAESNVGARLFIIGKDATLAGLNEITAATARLNAEIASGAKSSAVASAGYDEQAAALERYNLALTTSMGQLDSVATIGKYAFFGIAAAATVATVESIKWAQQYQTQLVQLRTQAGLTVTAMNAIGKAAMSNAANLGISPTAYLQAAYHPASTGMSVAQTIAITNNAARLAAIGKAPLEDTANALTGVMKAYNTPASGTQSTASLLNAIVGAGNMHYSDLNSALSSGIASTGKTFGVDMASIGGALAFMTDRGVPASQAGTHLRMSLALLGAPSAIASKLLTDAGMGSTTAQDATSSMAQTLQAAGVTTTQLSGALRDNSGGGGIYNALNLLKTDLTRGGLSPEMQAAMISRSFGGGRMGSTIEMMYNNVAGLGQKTSQIRKNGSPQQLMKDWAATTQTFDFQLHRLGGTIETLGTSLGTSLLPPLTEGLKLLTDTVSFLDHNKAAAVGLATVVTGILAPAIGLYLYRSLLSSGGAIRSVIGGYQTLLGLSPSVAAETDAVAGAEMGLASASRAAAGGLAGEDLAMGGGGLRGLGTGLMKGGMLASLGWMAGSALQSTSGATVHNGQTQKQMLESFGGDMLKGAGIGAGIGTFFGPEGTVIGGALGAGAGAIYSERHQIGGALDRGWDDLFGGGHASSTSSSPKIVVENHVYIDGKEVTTAVTKQTRKTTARY